MVNICGRWMVGLHDFWGLFQSSWFYDPLTHLIEEKKSIEDAVLFFFLPCLATYYHTAFNLLLPFSASPSLMWVFWSFLPLICPVPFPYPFLQAFTYVYHFLFENAPKHLLFSQITSPQDKTTTIKPLLTESDSSNVLSRLLPVLWSELTLTGCRSDLVATACPPKLPSGCEIWQARQLFS